MIFYKLKLICSNETGFNTGSCFLFKKKNAKKQETQGKLFLAGFIGKFFHNFSHLLCNFILILSEEPYCKNSLKHRITHTHSFSLSLFISSSLSTFWFYLQIWGFAIWHFSQEKTNTSLRFTGWVIKPFLSDKTKNFLTHKSIKSKLHPSI